MFIVHKFKYIHFLLSGIVVISVCLHAISITYLYLFGFFCFGIKKRLIDLFINCLMDYSIVFPFLFQLCC